jgi:hypothetical protein
MTYRCGISPELAVQCGMELSDSSPHVICDVCRVKLYVQRPSGQPYAWFMNRKNAPGWRMVWRDDGSSSHWCPKCKPMPADGKAGG